MTEPNSQLNPELSPRLSAAAQPAGDNRPERADAGAVWPLSPESAGAQDLTVSALLERLRKLPELPVADHEEVYAGLHEDLMEALNEDVSGHTQATRPDAAGGFAE